MKTFTAVIEKCSETGLYVGFVPGFPGAHSQGESLDELNRNLKEVIEMLLEDGQCYGGLVMGTVPVLKPKEVAAILEKIEFRMIRQKGSHKQYRHPDGRGTTLPFHTRRDISPILLKQIIKDIGLTVDEPLEHK